MARTIQSPGIEINEIDLSLRASLPVGTNVFVQGFADSGPTDELINVTSMTELEQIYGLPTNAAERYFFHSAKQVLQSPGNLLTNRMPYGLSGGGGYGMDYTALIFPVSSYKAVPSEEDMVPTGAIETNSVAMELFDTVTQETSGLIYGPTALEISTPGASAISGLEIEVTGQFGALWTTLNMYEHVPGELTAANLPISGTVDMSNFSSIEFTLDFTNEGDVWPGADGLLSGTEIKVSYSYNYPVMESPVVDYELENNLNTADVYKLGEPTLIELSDSDYMKWKSGNIFWSRTPNTESLPTEFDNIVGNAGLIIINKMKTSVDNNYGGYYLALKDNTNGSTNDGDFVYDSFNGFKFHKDSTFRSVPGSTIETPLSGDINVTSVSEDVESISDAYANFDSDEYNDCLSIGLFKLRQSATTQKSGVSLVSIPRERHVGSFDSGRKEQPMGQDETFFIEEIINDDSIFMEAMVNPYLATQTTWNTEDGESRKKVRTSELDKLYSIGSFSDLSDASKKNIGNLPMKLSRSLRLAENKDQIPIDIVVDGGLSTIHTTVMDHAINANECEDFDETQYLYGVFDKKDPSDPAPLRDQANGSSSPVQNNWSVIFNRLNTFCQETRRDCLFISDALRHIFVQNNLKTLEDGSKNFSQHIYWPLKNLFGAANSNYACTYANWVKVYDDYAGRHVWLPFSGYEANIMCRMDAALQPWYAPAGLNNGIIRGISDIALNPTQKHRDLLYRTSINPVVYFPGDGYTVWGQKTLQKKPSAFDRINVRRLFLVLAKATRAVMRYFVFEPNTVFTRSRVVNILSPIFEIAKNNEGVYDYLIVCDERNNTPQVIDNNELVVDIYLKPVRTAEFILINFYATRTDQDFTELI